MTRYVYVPLSIILLTAFGCGSGGGGSSGSSNSGNSLFSGGVNDPVVPLKGTGGTYSRTPEEANALAGGGGEPPLFFPATLSNGQNHFIRIEFPFAIDPSSVTDPSIHFGPFSQLNGQITITDESGQHLPGIVAINGMDPQGRDLAGLPGWPEELSASGRDRNLGKDRLVYIATDPNQDLGDNPLSSKAAFGGTSDDSDQDSRTTDIAQIRIGVNEVNGQKIDAFWTLSVGTHDQSSPEIEFVKAESMDPSTQNGDERVQVSSSFIVRFNEPVIPITVGHWSRLNEGEFRGNLPKFSWPNPPQAPLPVVSLTSPVNGQNPGQPPLYVPFDCSPVNPNNLTKYRLTPLIDLPSESSIDITVRSQADSQPGPLDYRQNPFGGGDHLTRFQTGPGAALVNAPVCPEVVFWTPSDRRGMGAIDLNGQGYTTNLPGAFSDREISRTSIITSAQNFSLIGRARDGRSNSYTYPVGTGSAALAYQTRESDPGSPGNPGTPIPGVNEKSSGFETLVRDSRGQANLTGGSSGHLGLVTDMMVGQMLDTVFFDTLNPWSQNSNLRQSFLNGGLLDRNSIADPPTPNPPPLRFALGLQPIGLLLSGDETGELSAHLIEGEEVFGSGGGSDGTGATASISRIMLLPNQVDPDFGFDEMPAPFRTNGPAPQSASSAAPSGFAARQQIGNFLYVCDRTNNQLKVLNSNTMRQLNAIDLPDPYGIGMSPNLKQLYVSNFGDDTVSVIGCDPFGENFHQEFQRISVGRGPRSVAVQPDNEDVFVCCWSGNTVDIIDPGRGEVRKSLEALVNRPYDVCLSDRQLTTGFQPGIYFGYISNFGGNNVLVYESGPDGTNGIGYDNILGDVPNSAGQEDIQILQPRGLVFDSGTNTQGVLAGGCYVAHQDERGFGVISRIQFEWQAQFGPILRNPPAGHFQPPGFAERRFGVVAQWGHRPGARLAGQIPTSVALSDLNVTQYHDPSGPLANGGALPAPNGVGANSGVLNSKHPYRAVGGTIPANIPDRIYVGFADADAIQVLDPNFGGTVLKTIDGVDPVGGLFSYWKQ